MEPKTLIAVKMEGLDLLVVRMVGLDLIAAQMVDSVKIAAPMEVQDLIAAPTEVQDLIAVLKDLDHSAARTEPTMLTAVKMAVKVFIAALTASITKVVCSQLHLHCLHSFLCQIFPK